LGTCHNVGGVSFVENCVCREEEQREVLMYTLASVFVSNSIASISHSSIENKSTCQSNLYYVKKSSDRFVLLDLSI